MSTARVAAKAPASRRLSGLGRFRLKTLDLYVARTFLVAYAICGVSFIGLFVLIEAFSKLDRFLRQESGIIETLVKYHLAMIPTAYANYMGPILTLAAGMFTMTTLNRQNELTPLKAAGISVYRAMLPVFFFAGCLTALTFYLKEQVIPEFKEPIRAALALARSKPLNPMPFHDAENGHQIRVSEYATTARIARRVEISEHYPNGKSKQIINAEQMEWLPEPTAPAGGLEEGRWILLQGTIERWDQDGHRLVNTSLARNEQLLMPFKRLELTTTLKPVDLETSDVEISYLSWRDLKAQYLRQPYYRHLEVKLHHHFAFPLSHIVLLFLGLPFVLNFQNRSGFMSLLMSFAICALFYLVSSIAMNLANQSALLTPTLGAWLPILLFGSLGITLFDQLPT